MICNALKLRNEQQQILLDLEPRSADSYSEAGTGSWFSQSPQKSSPASAAQNAVGILAEKKSSDSDIANWFKDEFQSKMMEQPKGQKQSKLIEASKVTVNSTAVSQEKQEVSKQETQNKTIQASDAQSASNQSLKNVNFTSQSTLSIHQLKHRIKALESKLAVKAKQEKEEQPKAEAATTKMAAAAQPTDEAKETRDIKWMLGKEKKSGRVYHDRPMTKRHHHHHWRQKETDWDDGRRIDDIDRRIAKLKRRIDQLNRQIESASSFESQESLQATAEKEAAEIAVHNALEFYNAKSLEVVKALDQANQQIDKQDVYSIKQIDQIAGGDKYDHEAGHAENARAMDAKQLVIDAEKERDDAAERLRVTTQLALEKHDSAVSEEERIRQERNSRRLKHQRDRLQNELQNLLEERKIAELEAKIQRKKRQNEEEERRLRREEEERLQRLESDKRERRQQDNANRIFPTYFEFAKREAFDLVHMSQSKRQESIHIKHSSLSAFNTQELEDQLASRSGDYLLVKNNKVVFSNCFNREYDYQRLVGFAILQNHLTPKDKSAADSHVMVWVQNNGPATDIYWKSELEMEQEDFDVVYQKLVGKGYGPVSLRMESGILQVAQHVTNKRIARQALAVGYYANAVLGFYNTVPNLTDPSSFGINEISRNRRN